MTGKFELKQAKDGQYHFNLLAANGQVILQSEMYTNKTRALNAIESAKKNAPEAARYERWTSNSGRPYFTLKAGNHQIIAQSQLYDSETARDHGIESVKEHAPDAQVVDTTV